MMIEKIDHLGIAVNSIEEARQFYENVLGLRCERIEEIASQKVRTAFFRIGEIHIELLEPTADDSPIAKFLASRGEGIHHVSYKSDDIQGELGKATEAGCRLIHAEPITGAGGKQVAFLHPKSSHGVLTEFCSDPE
jgi:methylmalonyl-CoA/ethylmalonyl-CoA epimerase